jgi:hypothetical protein
VGSQPEPRGPPSTPPNTFRLDAGGPIAPSRPLVSHGGDTIHPYAETKPIGAHLRPSRREWVVVTEERTSRSGTYAGMATGTNVTVARVVSVADGRAVLESSPRD